MADVKLRIEVNPDKESEFLNSIINDVGTISNASYKTNGSSAFVGLDNVNESGREMLSWANGVLQFTADGYLSNDGVNAGKLVSESEPDMFVWGAVPPSGEYSVKLTFKGTENLKDIIVYGDQEANQFPTEAIIDGTTTIYSDDYRWAINLGTESETHTIEFTKWNRANYNACLTRIMVMMKYFEVDKRIGLKSVESLSQSTAQPEGIYYGLISNSGSTEIIDINGEIADMVRDKVIPNSNTNLDLFYNGDMVQHHVIKDSNYNVAQKSYTSNLSNELDNWDNLEFAGYPYPDHSETAYIMLKNVFSIMGYKEDIDEMLQQPIIYGDNNIKGTIKSYLESIEIEYPYLPQDTFRATIDKFCVLAQLQLFQIDTNKIVFMSARPILLEESNIIDITPKSQISPFETDLIVKNQYNQVEIDQYNVIDEIKYDTGISNFEIPITSGGSWTEADANSFYNGSSFYAVARVDSYYTTGQFSFPKKSNFNLYDVKKINITSYNDDEYYDINNDYTKYSSTADITTCDMDNVDNVFATTYIYDDFRNTNSFFDWRYYGELYPYLSENEQSNLGTSLNSMLNYSITDEKITSTGDVISTTYTAELNDKSYFNITEDKDNVYVSYKVLTGVFNGFLKLNYVNNKWLSTVKFSEQLANKITITLNGDRREISFNPRAYNTSLNSKNTISLQGNHLTQDKCYYINSKIKTAICELITSNIIKDYHDGISTGSLSVNCIGKDLLEVGNIVNIISNKNAESIIKYSNGENMYFRITGRKFRYAGVPLIDLELQEAKKV